MGRYLLKQPNGLLCLWSTVTDCPVAWNMTKEDYIEFMVDQARKDAEFWAGQYFKSNNEVNERNHHIRSFEDEDFGVIHNFSLQEMNEFLKSIGSDKTADEYFLADEEVN